jgi:twinkle protein
MNCGFYSYENSMETPIDVPNTEFVQGEYQDLRKRGIKEETCKRWGYQLGEYKGRKVHIANYYRDGKRIAQKLRFQDKSFKVVGEGKNLPLYGSHLWQGGNRVTIVEGEIDALTVSQINQYKYPVLSIPNGAGGAEKTIRDNLEYLSRFGSVVLMFDNDEPGRQAAQKCAALLPPGKAFIAELPLKDPNEMLLAGRGEEVIRCMFNATPYRPDGILLGESLKDLLDTPIEYGYPYPWESVTEWTYGLRLHEIYTLLAGSGMGKTEVFKEIAYHLVVKQKIPCGVIFLEEVPSHTVKCFVGKHLGKRIHLPNVESTFEEREIAFDDVFGEGNLWIYDHRGCSDFEQIQAKIRYMVHSGIRFIFLDHITAMAEGKGEDNVNSRIHYMMEELNKMTQELPFSIFLISHIRKSSERKSAEEGGRVTADDAYGSGAIKQRSNFIFALERNPHGEESERNISTFRVLKDRFSGSSIGKTCQLTYSQETGRLLENSVDLSF